MSTDNRLLLIILLFITLLSGQQTQHLTTAQDSNKSATPIETGSRYEGGRAIYSPQLEYTEWVPLGRGDPLKNDPTYDYSPPKVDFVKYWADGTGHKEKGKTELLLLGVPQQRHKEPPNKHQAATRRNFAFNDLPTMLMPPPPATKQFNDHNFNPHIPIESYKMPVQPLNWNNNRKSVIDTYVEPGPSKTYTTIFRPILSSTIYQYHHTYKAPPVEGPNFIDSFHKPHVIHESYKIPLDNTELFLPTKPPTSSNNDLYFASSETRKPALIKTLEGSPFAKPSEDKHFTVSDSFDAQSINYAFTYQTSSTTTSTEKPTTPYVPLPPPPPETTTTQAPETTTSMYARFEQKTKPPRGPMSLVIEGHSKVKTYKPGQFDPKEKHRPVLVPIQSPDPIQRRVINTEENGAALEVKHLHSTEEKKSETKKVELSTTPKTPEKKLEKEGKEEKSAFSSLLSFLDTSFGDLVVQEESSEEQIDEENKIGAKNLEQNGGSDNNIRRSARNISPNEPHFVLKKLKP